MSSQKEEQIKKQWASEEKEEPLDWDMSAMEVDTVADLLNQALHPDLGIKQNQQSGKQGKQSQ